MIGVMRAQHNPQLAQYMLNGLPLNPAFTGTRGALSITGSHRSQWVGFDKAIYSQTFSIHTPSKNEKTGIGLYFFNDKLGVINKTGLMLNAAYQIKQTRGRLSLGLAGGFSFNKYNWSEVETTDANDEVFVSGDDSNLSPNFSAGLYYYTKKYYVSLSSPFMLTTKFKKGSEFKNVISPKGYNLYLNGGLRYKVSPKIVLTPSVMFKYLYASPFQTDINLMVEYDKTIHLGCSWRSNEAIIGILKFEVNTPYHIMIGYAFDYSLNEIQNYSSGSHEITFQFDVKRIFNTSNPRFF